MKFNNIKSKFTVIFTLICFVLFIITLISFGNITANAQSKTNTNVTSSGFRLVTCDGPKIPGNNDPKYTVCDFIGLIEQVQHIMIAAIIFGVLVALGGFSYAGYLFMTGTPNNITHARKILWGVVVGLLIMLSAWFIVFQILVWLTGDSGIAKIFKG